MIFNFMIKIFAFSAKYFPLQVEDYVRERRRLFDAFLMELEDLEFTIEEEKIKSEAMEGNVTNLIADHQSKLVRLVKKYKFQKCFYWE